MNNGPAPKPFTSALRFSFLTPAYDLLIRLFTREKAWRNKVAECLDLHESDHVLDVGCGTGSMAIMLKQLEPKCRVVAIDPDPKVLSIAKRKAEQAQVQIQWKQGFLDDQTIGVNQKFTKVLSTLVLHQTPVETKQQILKMLGGILEPSGTLCIADYGIQRTFAMKTMFRLIVQSVDGKSDTQPNADGIILKSLNEVGFRSAREETYFQTLTGSISVYVAQGISC